MSVKMYVKCIRHKCYGASLVRVNVRGEVTPYFKYEPARRAGDPDVGPCGLQAAKR